MVKDLVMDADVFQKEILERLDKIATLLSHSCQLSQSITMRSQTETSRQTEGIVPTDTSESEKYLIKDEMQDSYRLAMQKWKEEKNPAEEPEELTALDDPV